MKITKIALIFLMGSVAATTFSTANPALVYQIRKSRSDLLENTIIPQQSKQHYLDMAEKTIELRKSKISMNSLLSKPQKKEPISGSLWSLGSYFIGMFGIGVLKATIDTKDPFGLVMAVPAFYIAYKMFIKGYILNAKEARNIKSNKDKYFDALEVKRMIQEA